QPAGTHRPGAVRRRYSLANDPAHARARLDHRRPERRRIHGVGLAADPRSRRLASATIARKQPTASATTVASAVTRHLSASPRVVSPGGSRMFTVASCPPCATISVLTAPGNACAAPSAIRRDVALSLSRAVTVTIRLYRLASRGPLTPGTPQGTVARP